jgi:predicted transcriptional regulator
VPAPVSLRLDDETLGRLDALRAKEIEERGVNVSRSAWIERAIKREIARSTSVVPAAGAARTSENVAQARRPEHTGAVAAARARRQAEAAVTTEPDSTFAASQTAFSPGGEQVEARGRRYGKASAASKAQRDALAGPLGDDVKDRIVANAAERGLPLQVAGGLLDEARASVALDGDTQSAHVPANDDLPHLTQPNLDDELGVAGTATEAKRDAPMTIPLEVRQHPGGWRWVAKPPGAPELVGHTTNRRGVNDAARRAVIDAHGHGNFTFEVTEP